MTALTREEIAQLVEHCRDEAKAREVNGTEDDFLKSAHARAVAERLPAFFDALENAERERDDAQGAVQVYCDDFNRMKDERDGACRNAADNLDAANSLEDEAVKCRAVTVDLTNAFAAVSADIRASDDRVRVLENALRPFAELPLPHSLVEQELAFGPDIKRARAALGEPS